MSAGSVTTWMQGLRQGDQQAALRIWERYSKLMRQLAGPLMAKQRGRVADDEDAVQSAFNSLFGGARRGEFPEFSDRHDLWKLLVTITRCKAINLLKRENRIKRGGASKRQTRFSESSLGEWQRIAAIADPAASAEDKVDMAEILDVLFEILPDDKARQIAQLRLEGYTLAEIAKLIPCARATVDRRLVVIRRIWRDYLAREEL